MKQKIYKIKFFQVGEVYEIYAKNIYQSDFYAFLEIDGYIFDTKNNLVVDTSEEKLKAEFLNVQKTLLPINSIVRIDVVNEIGKSKISKADSKNLAQFPINIVPDKSNLSATGSKIVPNFVCQFIVRAKKPSKASVIDAIIKNKILI